MENYQKNLLIGQEETQVGEDVSGVVPGDSARQWAIFCPGPSLKRWEAAHINCDKGCLIAVNGAVLWPKGKTNWWVINDPEVFSDVGRQIDIKRMAKYGTKLWLFWNFGGMNKTREKNLRWSKDILEAYRLFEIEYWYKPLLPLGEATQVEWNEYSMFCAISLAIIKGAKVIKIYGADLSGEGYFRRGLTNWRMDHQERRWSRERLFFGHIVEECKRAGIEVVRLMS